MENGKSLHRTYSKRIWLNLCKRREWHKYLVKIIIKKKCTDEKRGGLHGKTNVDMRSVSYKCSHITKSLPSPDSDKAVLATPW